ncbi:MBL fold metallo-hydrolase [Candidatus Bathyarchaeota archaeon]|nr:MBL fold metallo-hydrolase [Candidatus Bathyarchaeota archaeon]
MFIKLVWFDSFGAKSSATLIKTRDVSVLIDPGIAVMQPSFPAPLAEKIRWAREGREEIKCAAKGSNIIVISHYHWDHFLPEDMDIYENKLIFAKNPNMYINDSQRRRALNFYSRLLENFQGEKLSAFLEKPKTKTFKDIFDELEEAKRRNFGDYEERRRELMDKGKAWFERRAAKWAESKWIPEMKMKNCEIKFAEGKTYSFGRTKIRFTGPLFHGIEYSRVGWVFSTVIESEGEKLLHSSDLNGPLIEDYASLIIEENPDYLILDGPMTYMLGYMFNLINFRRTLENAKRIVREVDFKFMIWDHHLPRERKFREHTKEVWALAKELNKNLLTAREFQFGKKPVVEELFE